MSRRVLVVDDEAAVGRVFQRALERAGYECQAAESAERGLSLLSEFDPGLVITDVRMPGMSGLELLEKLRAALPDVDVIVVTGFEEMETAVRAMKAGAYDYLAKPVKIEQIELVVERCFRDRATRRQVEHLSREAAEPYALGKLVGRTPRMIEIYKMIGTVATTRAAVLVRGETGTGKELIARAIHFNSPQAAEPFVAVNCTALPESLLESELFGHVRGAFTGAVRDRKGRFEQAGSGTIFLDEIGDTGPAFQAKLLRILEEREYRPVGSEHSKRTEARVIAATHRPIEELVREGTFREDLYFRLRVVEIDVPPLRERRDDIPLLAEHLLQKANRELHTDVHAIPDELVRTLREYDWPGNVRELENALTRAVVMARGSTLTAGDLLLDGSDAVRSVNAPEHADRTLDAAIGAHVQRVLQKLDGNKRQTAKKLEISRPRLDRLIQKHGLAVPGADG